jgi:hypothetical protein
MIPTFKRVVKRPHRIYPHDEVGPILDYLRLPVLERGAIAKIARDTGIPEPTLRDWHHHRLTDANWFPLSNGHPRARALNPESETAIADFLRDNYIAPGIGATRAQMKVLCLDSYAAQSDDERHLERFCASSTFLHDMENRQGLALRTPHRERRTHLDEDYAAYFLGRLNDLSNDYPPDLVYNMDETCWRLYETPRKVLAEKGAETVKLQAAVSEKTSFAALGAISVAGSKLPLWVVAKGTTQRCEEKFGHHPEVIFRHTNKGWATENLIVGSLEWLHREIADGLPCILIMDVYPCHRADAVFAAADANDVELLFVPAGATGRFQPMDRRVFGELKARARAEFARRMWSTGQTDVDHDESVRVLIRCWNAIPTSNVKKAWNVI